MRAIQWFSIRLNGSPGSKITVDWGDGSSDSYILVQGETAGNNELAHQYPTEGNYFVSITGDLQGITNFSSSYGAGTIDDINLEHLPELVDFQLYNSETPKTFDLTHNPKLEILIVIGSYELEKIFLPISHNIHSIGIDGPDGESQLTTSEVDSIINNIHHNAIKKNIKGGSFSLQIIWYHVGPYGEMNGPPSEEALIKLRELRDSYDWEIYPNP